MMQFAMYTPAISTADTETLDALRDALEAARAPLLAEIRAYPGPIAGCDVQFQRLLEQRQILTRDLGRLDALADGRASADALAGSLAELVKAASWLDAAAKNRFLAALR